MSIERTNRLRIALQKAKAGLEIENKVESDNPSKLGRLLNKPKTTQRGQGFIRSQPIHERPVLEQLQRRFWGKKRPMSHPFIWSDLTPFHD